MRSSGVRGVSAPRSCPQHFRSRRQSKWARASQTGSARLGTRNVSARDSGSDTAIEDVAETSEQEALDESRELEKRVSQIDSLEQLNHELDSARDRLVVLEIMAHDVCESGLFEPDDGWSPDQEEKERAKLEACEGIKHQFVRMAGDSPNVRFLALQEDSDEPSEVCEHLGVSQFPTVLFFKNKQVVWKAAGSAKLAGDTSEGLLYFSESPRLRSADHVNEMTTADEFHRFMDLSDQSRPDARVVMFTTPMCSPCIHVYPSYVTLAMNFADKMDFGRIDIEDGSPEMEELFRKQRIKEVPTFVIFHKGVEVSRDVSSHRGDLIGHILQSAMKLGIDPPRPKR